MTMEEYRDSPMVSWPLRKADCCQESDGAVAVLVTSQARAADLRQRPVRIRAAALNSRADIEAWLDDALDRGIDPL